ncbi:MAG: RNA polymerase sigma factor [Phycisphaerae bacterium]
MSHGLKRKASAGHLSVPRPGSSDWIGLDACRRRLVRLAVKLVWNRDDAEEIVQDALHLALRKKIDWDGRDLGGWLPRTVANLCLNHRRRRKAEPLVEWIEPRTGETPEALADRAERLEGLRSAIERLPHRQRTAIVLRCLEQREYAEIARVMGLSESAVRAHVHQGRRGLSDLLRARWESVR